MTDARVAVCGEETGPKRPNCFLLITPKHQRNFVLQASDRACMDEWMGAIERAAAARGPSAMDLEFERVKARLEAGSTERGSVSEEGGAAAATESKVETGAWQPHRAPVRGFSPTPPCPVGRGDLPDELFLYCEGFLTKRGNSFKSWKRWVVLGTPSARRPHPYSLPACPLAAAISDSTRSVSAWTTSPVRTRRAPNSRAPCRTLVEVW